MSLSCTAHPDAQHPWEGAAVPFPAVGGLLTGQSPPSPPVLSSFVEVLVDTHYPRGQHYPHVLPDVLLALVEFTVA
jgi:hypothetical protein